MRRSSDVLSQAEPRSLWNVDARKLETGTAVPPSHTDVAIIGAGYTGLWTALYMKMLDSSLDVTVLEKENVGFGASGRNGGWCSALLPTPLSTIAAVHGHPTAEAMRRYAIKNLDDIRTVLSDLSIYCDYAAGGTLTVARNRPQLQRLAELVKEERTFGATDRDVSYLESTQADEHIRVSNTLAAIFTQNCAVLHPRKLVDGLALACLRMGVSIVENINVVSYSSGSVTAEQDGRRTDISCQWVVRTTEGYTATFKQARREVLPLYSFMVATEPLSPNAWADIGWYERETLNDARNGVVYAQRTADGRIVFGGRGAPYHYASRVHETQDIDDRVHESLIKTLHHFFPSTREVTITHRWGGPLGVPRDWRNFARVDHQQGIAVGGGYTGDGVALAHLTGRMLAHGVLRREHPSLELPWFGHKGPLWEPEPLRWVAVNSLRKIADSIDSREEHWGQNARLRQKFVDRFLG